VLINNDIKDISLYRNKAYIATPSGISIIDIDKFVDTASPPKIYIRYLTAGGKTYGNLSTPVFSYYNGVITVAFAAITFQSNPALVYRYKIKGQNEVWNETVTDQVEFYNLAPGVYTLLLSARKYNSGWSQPVEYTFTVLPLWYQGWWFKILLALIAISLIYLWIRRVRKREREKARVNQKIAELKNSALASQMNPHFIFNAINSIQDFIFRNDELAANEYLSKFARLMRLFLESSKQAFISVKDETELLKLYMEMEKLRFEEKINFTIRIADDLDNATEIPTMMIQPFVENAINHGLVYKKGTGNLLIEFTASGQGVICVVDDDGIGIERSLDIKRGGHISRGMEMIDQRMTVYAGLQEESLFTYRVFDKMDAHGQAAGTRIELLFNV
jgi:signal transduction histidine kinase